MENAMYFRLTNGKFIIGGYLLFLLIIFALAAFLDRHHKTTAPLRKFGPDGKRCSFSQSFVRDGKVKSGALYSRHADLCTCGLGTSEQQICLRGEKRPNLTGD